MEPIKAFVAHSFTDDDANVVDVILKCLGRVAELHPRFSWEHAAHPEPTLVDDKVRALFADKNLFIGVCTRKERAISPSALSRRLFARTSLTAKESDFEWKTSDWIIQEIGLAIGRDMKIILLIEEGTRLPGALQGNLEHVPFNRNAPEKCFDALLGMIAALSPRVRSASSSAQEAESPSAERSAAQKNPEWTEPKAGWKTEDYELALMHFIATRNASEEQRINELFLASEGGGSEKNRKEWTAYGEYVRITFDRGGNLEKLERLAAESPSNSAITANLAASYSHYEEPAKAARAYERAADTVDDVQGEIRLLGNAVLEYEEAGNKTQALALEIRMRQRCEEAGQGEIDVLKAVKRSAEARKEDEVELAAVERLLELSPGDDDTRFSLAFKYSDMGRDDLAVYHYSRISIGNRTAVAWNNLGVSLNLLGMPIRSVAAYRRSEKLGETLAMSNLAHKFLEAGFLQEAKEVLDTALKIKDHHKNIDKALGTVETAQEAENKKETANHEKAKPMSECYREIGRSLAKPLAISIVGKWKGPNCVLEFAVDGTSLVAIGSYEVAAATGLLSMAILGGHASGLRRVDAEPTRYVVEYRGEIRGRTIFGSVSRERDGEKPKKTSTLLTDNEPSPKVLMWITDAGDKIDVLERVANTEPRRYVFERL